ncbi:MAG: hydroxyacid dehydrogenase [Theionarchaea archaeon]|nr:hydroxyacid dehydrogenase [Theionarchaea archaeon]MBU7000940.1 hydroxyacid dehydrogenase [Theionarchaea archaeon]MBU7021119.1 hydroxyacid dehydrogenase [Theionarchaea archaeon]MBU7033845.1 hydroxyacid dehydrogenase [Theionarchaea archaeon]MBU7039887.1 hydroxyacid dehydrogenase [Theionarchaea archaeon]
MKVLVLAKLHPEGLRVLREHAEVEEAYDLKEEEILKKVPEYEAVIVRSKPQITQKIIDAATNLKVIGRAGVGLDNIDVEYARSRGIHVVNTPEASTESVAEHVFALLLSKARDVPRADQALREGNWIKKQLMGRELYGKTLGIIGFGRIGSRLGEIAKGFKMRVLAYDVIDISQRAQEVGAEVVTLETLLQESDFLTLHVPLLPSTRNMISEQQLRTMKKGALLINTSRGGVIDEKALCAALIAGDVEAALDVFEQEPPTGSPLLTAPHIVLTPHIAGSTEEAQEKAGIEVAHKVIEALSTG